MDALKKRFLNHMYRHKSVTWETVELKLTQKAIKAIQWMEETGGEPDVVTLDGVMYIIDMCKESPKGRRSVCYDKEARVNRKKFPPKTSALELCEEHNVSLVYESMYYNIQSIEPLDLKSSSWVFTEASVRNLSGAIFGDNRYGRTFIYHNGADSYYGSRGFRTFIKI